MNTYCTFYLPGEVAGEKKSDKCVLALATVHGHFVSSSFDNVVRDFFPPTHADAKRI